MKLGLFRKWRPEIFKPYRLRSWLFRPTIDRIESLAEDINYNMHEILKFEQRLRELRMGDLLHTIRDREKKELEYMRQRDEELALILKQILNKIEGNDGI